MRVVKFVHFKTILIQKRKLKLKWIIIKDQNYQIPQISSSKKKKLCSKRVFNRKST